MLEPSTVSRANDNTANEFEKMRNFYNPDEERAFSALVTGMYGTGKTWSLKTLPKPVVLHSFDPGGGRALRDEIKKGEIIYMPFEDDNPANPYAFFKWEEAFNNMVAKRLFDNIGSFVMDSATGFTKILSYAIMHANHKSPGSEHYQLGSKSASVMSRRDYKILNTTTQQYLGLAAGVSCPFILTAHLDYEYNSDGNVVDTMPMMVGKLKNQIPSLMDEVYVANVKKTVDGLQYIFHLQPQGFFHAKSRLMGLSNGMLKATMPQDWKAIMKAAKFPTDDLPLFM